MIASLSRRSFFSRLLVALGAFATHRATPACVQHVPASNPQSGSSLAPTRSLSGGVANREDSGHRGSALPISQALLEDKLRALESAPTQLPRLGGAGQ